MKKFLVSISFIALIAAFYTFQSCTKEATETDNTEATINLMLQDKDFQDFAVLHNDFTGQLAFHEERLTGQQRKSSLNRMQMLCANPNATAEETKEVLSMLGFSDFKQYIDFLVKYKKHYDAIKNKFAFGKNASEATIQLTISKAYGKYSKNLQWQIKRDRAGSLYASNVMHLKAINSVQLRSCNCEADRSCLGQLEDETRAANSALIAACAAAAASATAAGIAAASTVILAPFAPGIAAGTLAMGLGAAAGIYSMATDAAHSHYCQCVKEKNPNCECN